MLMALFNGTIGVSLCFLIGLKRLGLDPSDILWSIIISNAAALAGLLLTLALEKKPGLKKTLLNGKFRTWCLLSLMYLAVLVGFCPVLRDPTSLLILICPLIFCTGFAIICFGPIQDWIISRSPNSVIKPKRSYLMKKSKNF